MKVYQTIISILEKKGPLPIPAICSEVNKVLITKRKKPLRPSQITSIVTRQKDIFLINREGISIHPDKNPSTLKVSIDCHTGTSYKIYVHFINNRFILFEWRNKESISPFNYERSGNYGSIEELKRELYSIRIWEWQPNYRKAGGIILDGTYWTITLNTKGKIHKSEGIDCFPPRWKLLCQAIERLTGVSLR